jgi:hypothetical protein
MESAASREKAKEGTPPPTPQPFTGVLTNMESIHIFRVNYELEFVKCEEKEEDIAYEFRTWPI